MDHKTLFIAHALQDGHHSSRQIDARLMEEGFQPISNQRADNPDVVNWLRFPVTADGHTTYVDFYIIALYAASFFRGVSSGDAFKWVKNIVLRWTQGITGPPPTIGWGALTKNVTLHGDRFLEMGVPEESVSTTHGDAGTAALVLQTLDMAEMPEGYVAGVIGANGVIGSAVARSLHTRGASEVVLVGRPDKPGENKKRQRLLNLASSIKGDTRISQNIGRAFHSRPIDVIVVATTGVQINPSDIPAGTLVLDLCTPAACQGAPEDWSHVVVLTAGCGMLPDRMLPESFGSIGEKPIDDVGAGGRHVIWGCFIETVVRSLAGWSGHLAGHQIPGMEVHWCHEQFNRLGIEPQPPVSLGVQMSWDEVRLRLHQASQAA